jgi:hypothetical protein
MRVKKRQTAFDTGIELKGRTTIERERGMDTRAIFIVEVSVTPNLNHIIFSLIKR